MRWNHAFYLVVKIQVVPAPLSMAVMYCSTWADSIQLVFCSKISTFPCSTMRCFNWEKKGQTNRQNTSIDDFQKWQGREFSVIFHTATELCHLRVGQTLLSFLCCTLTRMEAVCEKTRDFSKLSDLQAVCVCVCVCVHVCVCVVHAKCVYMCTSWCVMCVSVCACSVCVCVHVCMRTHHWCIYLCVCVHVLMHTYVM